MKIQQFNGGQASRLRPQYIGQNEAVSYINIDNSLGSLAPVKDKLLTTIQVQQYHKFFNAEQIWVDSAIPTDFLEYQQTMYTADGVQPKKTKNGQSLNLGIVQPSVAVSLENTRSVAAVTDFALLNEVDIIGAFGDLPLSDLRYRLVNVSRLLGDESFSEVTEVIVKASEEANPETTSRVLSEIEASLPVSESAVQEVDQSYSRTMTFSDVKGDVATLVYFYRYYKGVWRKAFEYNNPDIGPIQNFVDDTENIEANEEFDASLISSFYGTYQYVYTYYNSADGTESAPSPLSAELEAEGGVIEVTDITPSSDPQVTNIRLYRVGGNIAQFTLVTELDATATDFTDNLSDTEIDGRLLSSDNYSAAPTDLRYLAESYAMLFGAVGDNLRFTPIGKPNAWPPEYSIAFEDTITGIGPVANGVIVCTKFKTYIVTGTGPLSLAQQSLSGDQGCVAYESIQQIGPSLIWASAEGLCVSSGNNVTNITKDKLGRLNLIPVDSVVDDEVYYCHNSDGSTLAWDFRFGNIPKYLALDIAQVSVANSELYGWSNGEMFKLFQSANNLPLTYVSPRFVEGTITELKTYKKFHIYAKGDIILKILINDAVVFTKSLTGENDFQLQVPQEKQRGNFIQVEITGTGEVYEYEYVAGRDRNG